MTDARREPLTVRLDPADKRELEKACEAIGLDPGVAARMILQATLKRMRAMKRPSLLMAIAEDLAR